MPKSGHRETNLIKARLSIFLPSKAQHAVQVSLNLLNVVNVT